MTLEAHGRNNVQEEQLVKLYIPNTMKDWPWVRSINPLEDEVTAESIAWVSQFPYFTHRDRGYTDILLKGGSGAEGVKFPPLSILINLIGRFCALLYPTAPRGQ